MKTVIPSTTPDCEIVSTRVFNVSRELLFLAWTNPHHLKNWWGPAGFTNTFHEFDFRVGGRWRFTMHGPDKGHYENEAEFLIIDPPGLIAWKRHTQPYFQVVASFEEIKDHQTKLVFKMVFPSAKDRDKVIAFVPDKNEENFDRLEVELKRMGEGAHNL